MVKDERPAKARLEAANTGWAELTADFGRLTAIVAVADAQPETGLLLCEDAMRTRWTLAGDPGLVTWIAELTPEARDSLDRFPGLWLVKQEWPVDLVEQMIDRGDLDASARDERIRSVDGEWIVPADAGPEGA